MGVFLLCVAVVAAGVGGWRAGRRSACRETADLRTSVRWLAYRVAAAVLVPDPAVFDHSLRRPTSRLYPDVYEAATQQLSPGLIAGVLAAAAARTAQPSSVVLDGRADVGSRRPSGGGYLPSRRTHIPRHARPAVTA